MSDRIFLWILRYIDNLTYLVKDTENDVRSRLGVLRVQSRTKTYADVHRHTQTYRSDTVCRWILRYTDNRSCSVVGHIVRRDDTDPAVADMDVRRTRSRDDDPPYRTRALPPTLRPRKTVSTAHTQRRCRHGLTAQLRTQLFHHHHQSPRFQLLQT